MVMNVTSVKLTMLRAVGIRDDAAADDQLRGTSFLVSYDNYDELDSYSSRGRLIQTTVTAAAWSSLLVLLLTTGPIMPHPDSDLDGEVVRPKIKG